MIDSLITRAQQLIQLQRYPEAERTLKEALAVDPNRADALALLSICVAEQGKTEEAERLIKNAISQQPDNDYFIYLHAAFLLQLEKVKDAETAVRNAISYNPQNADYFGLLAQLKLSQKEWKEALENADKGLAIDPDNLGCLNTRSTALFKLERKDEAHATIQEALSKDPENEYTHTNIGWSLLERGDHKKALEHFREALKINPNYAYAKSSLVEGLKARYLFYRIFLRYAFWLSNFKAKGQWAIIIGLYIGVKLLQNLAASNPSLAVFITPIIYLYFAFALSTWIITPLSNLFLRLNVYGRFALTEEETNASSYVGISLLVGLLGGVMYLTDPHPMYVLMLGYGITMMIPLASMFNPTKKKSKTILLLYTAALGLTGLGAIIQCALSGEMGILTPVYMVGLIAYQWVVNWIMIK